MTAGIRLLFTSLFFASGVTGRGAVNTLTALESDGDRTLEAVSRTTPVNGVPFLNGPADAFHHFASGVTKLPLSADTGADWRIAAASLAVVEGAEAGNPLFSAGAKPFQAPWLNSGHWSGGIGAPNDTRAIGISWNTPSLFANSGTGGAQAVPGHPAANGGSSKTAMDTAFTADLMADDETTFYRAAMTGTTAVDFGAHDPAAEAVPHPNLRLTVESILELAAVVLGIASLLVGGWFLLVLHRRRHYV